MKNRLHEYFQRDRDFTKEDMEALNPTKSRSIEAALNFVSNPVKMCDKILQLIHVLNEHITSKKNDGELYAIIISIITNYPVKTTYDVSIPSEKVIFSVLSRHTLPWSV